MILGSICAPYFGVEYGNFVDNLVVERVEDTTLKEKRIMVIGPFSSVYLNGQIAGPFLDEGISRRRLGDLDYYQKAYSMLKIFRRAEPDVIIDSWDTFNKIEFRLPEVKKMDIEVRK